MLFEVLFVSVPFMIALFFFVTLVGVNTSCLPSLATFVVFVELVKTLSFMLF